VLLVIGNLKAHDQEAAKQDTLLECLAKSNDCAGKEQAD
jgi:hypothetical protein